INQSDLTLNEVFKRTRASVYLESDEKQMPWTSSSVIGDFYFQLRERGSRPSAPLAISPTMTDADRAELVRLRLKDRQRVDADRSELAHLRLKERQKIDEKEQKELERLRKIERDEKERQAKIKAEEFAKLEQDRRDKAEREAKAEIEREAARLQQEKLKRESENYTKYRVVNVASWDTLNVRTNPFVAKNNKVGELQHNARNIKILYCRKNHKKVKWCQIEHRTNGYPLRGWVVARCIKPQDNTYTVSRSGGYRVVNIRSDDTLSVRSGPGINYYKTGDLPYNATGIELGECRYSSKGGRWCIVKWGSITGWSSATYLRR
ncbi:MAG: hypothetical protein U9R27_01835, partial [Campylobacterota bacterium]|nr:hypothetical protein [Campylobacterota bacterium]